jgi:hypothetical protein
MRRLRNITLLLMLGLLPVLGSGCVYPFFLVPIPVPPWVTERMEEKYCDKNDFRTPIMPPIRDGVPEPTCEDPPSEKHILRAMPPVTRGVPYVYEEFRENYGFSVRRIKDTIDPPRFYPLVGPARLHHCHYECTIYYTETFESAYPFPFRCKKNRVQVVYIDKDHLHLCPGSNPQTQESFARDLTP